MCAVNWAADKVSCKYESIFREKKRKDFVLAQPFYLCVQQNNDPQGDCYCLDPSSNERLHQYQISN